MNSFEKARKKYRRQKAVVWIVSIVVIFGTVIGLSLWLGTSPPEVNKPRPAPTPVQTVDPNYHVTWDYDGIHCRDLAGRIVSTTHCVMPTP